MPQAGEGGTGRGGALDAVIRIRAPDGQSSELAVEAKSRFTPKSAVQLRALVKQEALGDVLVISPFLSKATRERLRGDGLNWLDLSGNMRLVLNSPALYVERQGTETQEGSSRGPVRSLKGAKAGRLVRQLLAANLPVTGSALAGGAGVDAGYTSRVLEMLEEEALIVREKRGPVTQVDKGRLVRRWAEDAPIETRGSSVLGLEPRGLDSFLRRLRAETGRYAVTGSLAAQQWAPIAAPRLAQIYVSDEPGEVAKRLALRPGDAGANVQLIRPRDPEVLRSAQQGKDGLWFAVPVQVAADLLTSPGRGPAEGEALLEWMGQRVDAWR